jgi:pyruvate kinase
MKIEIEDFVIEEMIDLIETSEGKDSEDVQEYRDILESARAAATLTEKDCSPEC